MYIIYKLQRSGYSFLLKYVANVEYCSNAVGLDLVV
jgi:hypothetical protein